MSRHDFRIWDINSSNWVDKTGEDVIIQQSTGMLDRNDVEIYEGDIVHIDFVDSFSKEIVIVAEIVWDEDKSRFAENWKNVGRYSGLHTFIPGTCTVKGNIFDEKNSKFNF